MAIAEGLSDYLLGRGQLGKCSTIHCRMLQNVCCQALLRWAYEKGIDRCQCDLFH